jgi:hypothetical protein
MLRGWAILLFFIGSMAHAGCGHPDVAFSVDVKSGEGGLCSVQLIGQNCPADPIEGRFFIRTNYKNTTCRLAVDDQGAPIYQHLSNGFTFVILQSTGARFPANTYMIGVSQDCRAIYQTSEKTILALAENIRPVRHNHFSDGPTILGTKELSPLYDDILTQAGMAELMHRIHPRGGYSLTGFHRWDESPSCE